MSKVIRSNLEPEEKFRKIIEVHFQTIEKYSLEYQVVLNERRYMLEPAQEREIRRKLKIYEDQILEVIEEGIQAKVFRSDLNPRVISSGIIGVGNALYKWFSPDGPLSFDDVTRIYINFFLNGIVIK